MDVLLPEWSPRRALILRWPWRPDIWPSAGRDAQAALLQLLNILAAPLQQRDIRIQLEVPAAYCDVARQAVPSTVEIIDSGFADIWIRDCAPFYVGKRAVVTDFNGWAGLDSDYADDLVAREALCTRFNLQPTKLDLVLEGGSVHTDGAGLLVYIKTAVLDPNRNPLLNQIELHQLLRAVFKVTDVVALDAGLASDETGGHTDNLLTFLSADLALVSMPVSPQHGDYKNAQSSVAALQSHGINVLTVPQPDLQLSAEEASRIVLRDGVKQRHVGMPLTASYANGIRIDDIYVVPKFGVPEDALAYAAICAACPQLTVLQAPARALLVGGGGWHCASHSVV